MPTSPEDVAHLLRRAGFAPLPAEIAALTSLDRPAVVEHVLDTSTAPPAPPPPELANPALSEWDKYVAVLQWWIERMRSSPCPIQEKMTLFWHGHFVSSLDKVGQTSTMLAQNQKFRTMGMGSFRALTQAIAVDPAMLRYLDNADNVAGAPNENFARELMELFTVGTGQYRQEDVVASARAWTGYGLDSTGTAFVFDPASHDAGAKTFLGISRNWDGPGVIDELLAGSLKPVAARFMAGKLWSFFAFPRPSPVVLDAITADFLTSTDLNVTALLRSIFNRPEFYSTQAKTGLVRSPVELVVAALRYSGVSTVNGHPEWYMDGMGQLLFYPPNVAGWHQNGYWISTASFWARAGFVRNLTWTAQQAGLLAGTGLLSPAEAVAKALATFGITAPSAATVSQLQAWLAGERSAQGWAEQPNLITLPLLTPDFQLAQ